MTCVSCERDTFITITITIHNKFPSKGKGLWNGVISTSRTGLWLSFIHESRNTGISLHPSMFHLPSHLIYYYYYSTATHCPSPIIRKAIKLATFMVVAKFMLYINLKVKESVKWIPLWSRFEIKFLFKNEYSFSATSIAPFL
jgi:hypothetical protein